LLRCPESSDTEMLSAMMVKLRRCGRLDLLSEVKIAFA
jgi:hypothetical protein